MMAMAETEGRETLQMRCYCNWKEWQHRPRRLNPDTALTVQREAMRRRASDLLALPGPGPRCLDRVGPGRIGSGPR